ncbi:serine-threonine/tyrosine-protein kinase catalytic domain-containing protein [Tanacetum coccineum]
MKKVPSYASAVGNIKMLSGGYKAQIGLMLQNLDQSISTNPESSTGNRDTDDYEVSDGLCLYRQWRSSGYGPVYKGELLYSGKPTKVAVKRLNEQFGQGLKEFLTEIQLLNGQWHPNVISFLGYCDEGKEKILVYEFAEHGSLDRYIRRRNTSYTMTWLERLKIAKIADFGLSELSLAARGAVITLPCGTLGYCDPEYISTGIVRKESDVYSFGTVLFEVLCGRLCAMRDEEDGLVLSGPLVKDYYKKKKLDDHYNICHIPQRQIRGIPGDLSLGICFPGGPG